QLVAVGEPLDGLDLAAVRLDCEQHAALEQAAVDDDGARAAVAGVAADVASGEVEVVAQEVDEQLPRLDVALVHRAVDGDRDVHQRVACLAARSASTSARCARYSLDACTSDGGSSFAARTAARTSSTESASTSTGTASTQPSAMRSEPFMLAAAFVMHMPPPP